MTSEHNHDRVLTSILQSRFKAITQEMGNTLLRTTRSPILNEARDFVTGLYDAKGRMLEQTEYIPVLAFALQPVCQHIVDYFADDKFGPLARHEANLLMQKRFDELPPDVKAFVAEPINLSYLETAMRLSALDVDQLRNIAEGILDITF